MGFLYMLIAVNFKLFGDKSLIYHLMGARFSQPWSRGRLGGFGTLLNEFGLLLYAVPPLAGVIINRWKSFPKLQFILALLMFFLTMFQGISGGTRNVFISYMATFVMGYFLTVKKNTIINTIFPLILSVWFIGFASYHMLEFRTMGLRKYLENRVYATGSTRETLAVDYNLASMGKIASNVPSVYAFAGPEIITWSIVKPIPRAFWPSKPEGLSISLEEMAGAGGWTIAITFIGEAYVTAGLPGVLLISLGFGALAAWWNRMAIASQTDYGLVVYALGFFAAGLTMRSMLWLTTAALPVIALVLFRKYGPFK
jgi:oligosaccharide repeat unit polymerase